GREPPAEAGGIGMAKETTVTKLNVNGKVREFDAEPDTPLLWVLREQLDLTGTKYGCGIAQCGACTVHIDGVATRSCVRPVSTVGAGEKIVTIEGLSPNRSPAAPSSAAPPLPRAAWPWASRCRSPDGRSPPASPLPRPMKSTPGS